ncbi:uncharacterized protein Pyn_30461 [Prunus yedoensis var. nudiflora]|uniref:CCHC-type domain-containing protein n=1 Tax=Prunus yedoensis var. nudiflora TaxID=2094558 RepID=A0A314XS59_PRUYE|nr:uncharacterized protein Pyn_30461 [Prunus yedoensis var. nudiflora]
MADTRAEDLVIRLEESLGISNLESGPKLAGAIIADKIPNRGAIKTILQNAWAIYGEAKISHIKGNLFTVVVQDEGMADQIISDGPWSVMGFCFNAQRWPSNLAIEELPLHKVAYWIQAHGIPLNLLTAGNALEIGEKLGEVKEVEDPWEKGSRGFLRMRVMIDSNNPLPQGFWLPRAEGQDTWVEFKFERLSDFCFICGKLGHLQRSCNSSGSLSGISEQAAYGEWMKARAIRDNRPPVSTHVPRGVRRRAGQIGVVRPGVLVARVGQIGDESSGTSHSTQPPAPANQAILENVLTQQEKSLHCHTADATYISAATDLLAGSSSHQSGGSKTKGNEVDIPSNLNAALQIYNWNSERGRADTTEERGRVILVEENCQSHWPWPTGRVGPIPFEERLQWAKTQIAFGKHYVTDWAVLGPSERRQSEENLDFRNEIAIEPNFNSPFDTIPASTYQIHHKEVDEAFIKMGLKRDADPGWQKSKNEIKRAKSQSERQETRQFQEGNRRLRRNFSSARKTKHAVESERLSHEEFSEEG